MKQTWRWFGPEDGVSIADMLQSGVEGVVTSLYDVKPGSVWETAKIHKRKSEVETWATGEPTGLTWDVVESLPVSEAIKTLSGAWRDHVHNFVQSMHNLAASGIHTICYNFMPVLDWTRTDVAWHLPNGGTAMRFDLVDFAMFDIMILQRKSASADYDTDIASEAEQRFKDTSPAALHELSRNITAGLPGAVSSLTLDDLKAQIETYCGIDHARLRANLRAFLEEVVPEAEALGIRLCCHPDDPPWPVLGLPRIVSTADDLQFLLDAVESPANGVTFCTGSFGARPENDLPRMIQRFGPRIHFLHLRNVCRQGQGVPTSFFEDEHLAGSTDMVAVVRAVLDEEARRRNEGRPDHSIPMRPDHGQDILTDLGTNTRPGYPLVGRMKGLAELRGVVAGLGG